MTAIPPENVRLIGHVQPPQFNRILYVVVLGAHSQDPLSWEFYCQTSHTPGEPAGYTKVRTMPARLPGLVPGQDAPTYQFRVMAHDLSSVPLAGKDFAAFAAGERWSLAGTPIIPLEINARTYEKSSSLLIVRRR